MRVFGVLLIGFSLTLLVPLVFSWYWADGAEWAYDEAFALTLATGMALWWSARCHDAELKVRDGFLMVVLVWSVLPIFAGMPLMFQLGISFTDAYFEAMSGLTTTGATVLSNLDTLPPSINLWRGMTGLARRHGPDRAGGGDPAAARHRRPPDVQGRDAGADEGFAADAAHDARPPRACGCVYAVITAAVHRSVCTGPA